MFAMRNLVLQLGHAGEGVEIFATLLTGSDNDELQLGHAGEGVEMRLRAPADVGSNGFNWATPVKAWR